MLSEIIHIMEYTLYIYLSVSVGYIVLFSAASHFFKTKEISRDYCPATFYHPCSRL